MVFEGSKILLVKQLMPQFDLPSKTAWFCLCSKSRFFRSGRWELSCNPFNSTTQVALGD